jgi:hypothetical protein
MMSEPCSTRGKVENATNILSENQKGRDHLEHIGIYGKIIFCYVNSFRMWNGFVRCKIRVKRRTVVDTVMKY